MPTGSAFDRPWLVNAATGSAMAFLRGKSASNRSPIVANTIMSQGLSCRLLRLKCQIIC
jgi:hypothetical protein